MIRFNSIVFFKGELWATKGAQEVGKVLVVDPETLELARTVVFDLGSFLENSVLSVYNKQFRLFSDGQDLYSVLLDVKTLPNPDYQTQVLEEDKKRREEEKQKKLGRGKKKEEKKEVKKEKKIKKRKDKKVKKKLKDKKPKEEEEFKKTTEDMKKIIQMVKSKESKIEKEMTEIMKQAKRDILQIEKAPIFGYAQPLTDQDAPADPSLDPFLVKTELDKPSLNSPPIQPAELEKLPLNLEKSVDTNSHLKIIKVQPTQPKKGEDPKMSNWFMKNIAFETVDDKKEFRNFARREISNRNRFMERNLERAPRINDLIRDSFNQELMDELALIDIIKKKEAEFEKEVQIREGIKNDSKGNAGNVEGLKFSRICFVCCNW